MREALTNHPSAKHTESLSKINAVIPPRQFAAFFMLARFMRAGSTCSLVGVENSYITPARGKLYAASFMPRVRPTARIEGSLSQKIDEAMNTQSTATSVAPTIPQLRDAIESMDSLSEIGFSEIASIAKMALAYLETPNVDLRIEDIANALSAIQGKAEDIKNCINYQAEEVGCNYVDEAKLRRLNVWFKGN